MLVSVVFWVPSPTPVRVNIAPPGPQCKVHLASLIENCGCLNVRGGLRASSFPSVGSGAPP